MLGQIERTFDSACEWWRTLYRAAVCQRALHHAIIGDHSRPDTERKHSLRLRAPAESQIRLLTKAEEVHEGNFYSYRYFATEGFLPGCYTHCYTPAWDRLPTEAPVESPSTTSRTLHTVLLVPQPQR